MQVGGKKNAFLPLALISSGKRFLAHCEPGEAHLKPSEDAVSIVASPKPNAEEKIWNQNSCSSAFLLKL